MTQEIYPSILKRYLSTFIDSVFMLSMLILVSFLFQKDSQTETYARVGMIFFLFLVYEPFCTSNYCTLGQKITGVRVRTVFQREKITLPKAYLRIVIKILLGFVSFFSIPFTPHKRAIHDLVVGSVVIESSQ